MSLTEQAVKNRLVTWKVRANLECVDPNVPHPVKCRYLLYSVYQHSYSLLKVVAGEVNTKAYAKWLQVLSKWKATACVRVLVSLWSSKDLPLREADLVLTKNYILFSTGALSGCCSQWKEIAVALRLPVNEVKKIQTRRYTAIMCLKDVFTIWVRHSLRFGLLSSQLSECCYDECCCNQITADEFKSPTLQN